jgi:hypothetical protein
MYAFFTFIPVCISTVWYIKFCYLFEYLLYFRIFFVNDIKILLQNGVLIPYHSINLIDLLFSQYSSQNSQPFSLFQRFNYIQSYLNLICKMLQNFSLNKDVSKLTDTADMTVSYKPSLAFTIIGSFCICTYWMWFTNLWSETTLVNIWSRKLTFSILFYFS